MEERLLINAQALRRISRSQGLPTGMVEKDYVISWFLKEVYENALLKEALIFKGGTALRKVYFPETWRLSHDLDSLFSEILAWKRLEMV
jgi:predicted nucleotidyltransferase component of viral defense system